jgi:hypothetical protein
MQYRRLGDVGIKVSAIGLGGWINYGVKKRRRSGAALQDGAISWRSLCPRRGASRRAIVQGYRTGEAHRQTFGGTSASGRG